MMMTEIKMAPQESAAAGERMSGKIHEKLAARRVVILLKVSAQICFDGEKSTVRKSCSEMIGLSFTLRPLTHNSTHRPRTAHIQIQIVISR